MGKPFWAAGTVKTGECNEHQLLNCRRDEKTYKMELPEHVNVRYEFIATFDLRVYLPLKSCRTLCS